MPIADAFTRIRGRRLGSEPSAVKTLASVCVVSIRLDRSSPRLLAVQRDARRGAPQRLMIAAAARQASWGASPVAGFQETSSAAEAGRRTRRVTSWPSFVSAYTVARPIIPEAPAMRIFIGSGTPCLGASTIPQKRPQNRKHHERPRVSRRRAGAAAPRTGASQGVAVERLIGGRRGPPAEVPGHAAL